MTPERKQKLQTILETRLNRAAKPNELINAETDQILINQIILDELEAIRTELAQLKV